MKYSLFKEDNIYVQTLHYKDITIEHNFARKSRKSRMIVQQSFPSIVKIFKKNERAGFPFKKNKPASKITLRHRRVRKARTTKQRKSRVARGVPEASLASFGTVMAVGSIRSPTYSHAPFVEQRV